MRSSGVKNDFSSLSGDWWEIDDASYERQRGRSSRIKTKKKKKKAMRFRLGRTNARGLLLAWIKKAWRGMVQPRSSLCLQLHSLANLRAPFLPKKASCLQISAFVGVKWWMSTWIAREQVGYRNGVSQTPAGQPEERGQKKI